MINFESNVNSSINTPESLPNVKQTPKNKPDFQKAAESAGESVSKVDEQQKAADSSIKDLLAGKNNDVTSVVSDVAKADMSFKLLVGVRNKLIEAYKQTMNMPI